MMDEIDSAQDHMEKELAQSIERVRAAASRDAAHFSRGACLNCDEPVEGSRKFCSTDCAEDHEHRARQLKRLGVR